MLFYILYSSILFYIVFLHSSYPRSPFQEHLDDLDRAPNAHGEAGAASAQGRGP